MVSLLAYPRRLFVSGNSPSRRVARAVFRRLRFVIFQLLGVMLLTFVLIRLVPGDPARVIAGPAATPSVLQAIRKSLGLDQPLPVQFYHYLGNVLHGNLGTSILTGHTVISDLASRLPATLELITSALIISLVLGVTFGLILARRRARVVNSGTFVYSMLAGAIPDFWLGLLLIYFFTFKLKLTPAPIGRLGFQSAPPHVTGFLIIDSLIAGDFSTLWSAIQHLILPVATLVVVYTGQIIKITRLSTEAADKSSFVDLYDGFGVEQRLVRRRATRLAMPPVLTISGITYGYLLGGAVLVETVFAWGGVGQYAVNAVRSADYPAIQGFVLLAATFNIVVYLVVDVLLLIVDPRISRAR
jgi:peptide/nickel transport system permease protein